MYLIDRYGHNIKLFYIFYSHKYNIEQQKETIHRIWKLLPCSGLKRKKKKKPGGSICIYSYTKQEYN